MGAPDLKVPKDLMFDYFSHRHIPFWWVWDPVPDWFRLDDKIRIELFKESLAFNKAMLAKNIEIMQDFQVHIDKQMEIIERGM